MRLHVSIAEQAGSERGEARSAGQRQEDSSDGHVIAGLGQAGQLAVTDDRHRAGDVADRHLVRLGGGGAGYSLLGGGMVQSVEQPGMWPRSYGNFLNTFSSVVDASNVPRSSNAFRNIFAKLHDLQTKKIKAFQLRD